MSGQVRSWSGHIMSGFGQLRSCQVQIRSRSKSGKFRLGINHVRSVHVRTAQVEAVRSR